MTTDMQKTAENRPLTSIQDIFRRVPPTSADLPLTSAEFDPKPIPVYNYKLYTGGFGGIAREEARP